mmetsp:Transcript_9983/g.18842  ORF Transcript_9983/g.18842 Transcript_9983/m.18842 type:complete len:478 (+) Transcript_9983:213-1646(+)|eukprot:CAMPEP_0114279650 /NCGR_PEP_ID=MMETSP0059-20121206/2005_1 /TAXON_ID=36894 /ORGANISM="Pyramimonas parkeae, Strain CCMP726" /LENGTH=477 /DNA_ID=CAMNT_0001399973 /DNA_START=167 /DNA_END=1600 /DNA_ORIENTATION=-
MGSRGTSSAYMPAAPEARSDGFSDYQEEDKKEHGHRMQVLLWLRGSALRKSALVVLFVFVLGALVYIQATTARFNRRNIHYQWIALTLHPTKAPSEGASDPMPKPAPANPLMAAPGHPMFQYMHMGMLEKLPNGSIAAVFQASSVYYEGNEGQGLFWTTSRDGEEWTLPSLLVPPEGTPIWSPVMHSEGGRVWTFFSRSDARTKYWDKARNVFRFSPGGDILAISSDNSGLTWTPPQVVFSYESENEIPKVLANKLIVLTNGAWALPFWREPCKKCIFDPITHPKVKGSAGLLVSGDQGLTWEPQGHIQDEDTWLIENSVVELPGLRLLQFFRTSQGYLYYSMSYDMGVSWTEAKPSMLRNPNSKSHVLRISARPAKPKKSAQETPALVTDGPLLCAFNNSPNRRTPLAISISHDEGRHWSLLASVETNWDLQYAYPTMLETENKLYVIYAVMRKDPDMRLVALGMRLASFSLAGVE